MAEPAAGRVTMVPWVNDEPLEQAEIGKDAVQGVVEAAAGTVGQVTTILTTAVKDVAGALGGFATELFEIRDSAAAGVRGRRRRDPAETDLGD